MGFELDWHPEAIREKTLENHGFFLALFHPLPMVNTAFRGIRWGDITEFPFHRVIPIFRPVSENVTLKKVSWCVARFLALRFQIREDGAL